ncbi:MAG TPA: hypothetical protein DCS44_03265 [Cyanobacteria bacterium UBA10660]|nr:MAG TPA: hypothetical protein CPT83_08275 [Candidatus Gastranaerophilales bacterium HUM_1]HAS93622.1 hypothetical protein [Cyanobacteria bacterium UBA10660]
MDMKSFYANEKPKTKRKGFSLVEMMVVMLLIAVVLAASAPMITRKVSRERSDKIFDMLGTDPNNAVEYVKGRNQRIFMNGRKDGYIGIVETGVNIPTNSVLFGQNILFPFNYATKETSANNLVGIGFGTTNYLNSVAIGYKAAANTDSVTIGNSASGSDYGVAIGSNSQTRHKNSVAIGYSARTTGENAVAIGASQWGTEAGERSVAIGYGAKASYERSIAIGANASVMGENSIAIGNNATAHYKNTVVLGDSNTTVFIPGNLVVNHAALIGRAAGRNDNLYFRPYAQEDGRHFAVLNAGDWKGEDSNLSMVQDDTDTDNLVVRVGPYSTQTERWRRDYKDNNRTHINFEDPTRGNDPKSHRQSDIRLKNVGEPFTAGLNELEKLNFYHFTFKKDKDQVPQVGVMAQDLQKVFPQAVSKDDGGWLTIRWDEMFYAAINAIKELNTKVCAIAKDVTNLKTVTDEHTKTLEAQAQTIEQQQVEIKELTARVEKLEQKRK